MQSYLLRVSNLCIERGERELCRNLSFTLTKGDVVRIAGENGAGKSTLLKVLIGLLQPFSGEIYYHHEDVTLYRDVLQQDTLYLGHSSAIKSVFTVMENLRWYCPAASVSDIASALQAVSLAGYEDTPASQLSAGQKRRITLARLWLTNKPIWLLDEPFTALDVHGVAALERRMLEHVQAQGAILLTTHQAVSAQLNMREIELSV